MQTISWQMAFHCSSWSIVYSGRWEVGKGINELIKIITIVEIYVSVQAYPCPSPIPTLCTIYFSLKLPCKYGFEIFVSLCQLLQVTYFLHPDVWVFQCHLRFSWSYSPVSVTIWLEECDCVILKLHSLL